MMRHVDIEQYLRRRPFVPVRLHMTDGKTFDITSPESVFVMTNGIEIGLFKDAEARVVEKVLWCAFIHIARVELLESAAAGRRKSA
ncbi:MAG TPA: hypothetical protein VGP72_28730 [Planctomycetota bacterium]